MDFIIFYFFFSRRGMHFGSRESSLIFLSLRAFAFENKTWFWEFSPRCTRPYELYLDPHCANEHQAGVLGSKESITCTAWAQTAPCGSVSSELPHSPVLWSWARLISPKMIPRYFRQFFFPESQHDLHASSYEHLIPAIIRFTVLLMWLLIMFTFTTIIY